MTFHKLNVKDQLFLLTRLFTPDKVDQILSLCKVQHEDTKAKKLFRFHIYVIWQSLLYHKMGRSRARSTAIPLLHCII
jgi:hypothetical protein